MGLEMRIYTNESMSLENRQFLIGIWTHAEFSTTSYYATATT